MLVELRDAPKLSCADIMDNGEGEEDKGLASKEGKEHVEEGDGRILAVLDSSEDRLGDIVGGDAISTGGIPSKFLSEL